MVKGSAAIPIFGDCRTFHVAVLLHPKKEDAKDEIQTYSFCNRLLSLID